MNRNEAIDWCNRFYQSVWNKRAPARFRAAIDDLASKDCGVIRLPRGESVARWLSAAS